MRDIIPEVLGEAELLYLSAKGYEHLRRLMNPVIYKYITAYRESPDANPLVLMTIDITLKDSLESYGFCERLEKAGIIRLLTDRETAFDVYLQFGTKLLEDVMNHRNVFTALASQRPDEVFTGFIEEIGRNVYPEGVAHYSQIQRRLLANKGLFVQSSVSVYRALLKNFDRLQLALKGLRYFEYCVNNGITNRRDF